MTLDDAMKASIDGRAWRDVHDGDTLFWITYVDESPMRIVCLDDGYTTTLDDMSHDEARTYEDWEPCEPKDAVTLLGEVARPSSSPAAPGQGSEPRPTGQD